MTGFSQSGGSLQRSHAFLTQYLTTYMTSSVPSNQYDVIITATSPKFSSIITQPRWLSAIIEYILIILFKTSSRYRQFWMSDIWGYLSLATVCFDSLVTVVILPFSRVIINLYDRNQYQAAQFTFYNQINIQNNH